jgi:hypothetical protein
MATVLTNKEFGSLFESFRETAFRLETLDLYTVPEEAVEYRRFLAGEQLPTSIEDEWAQFVKKTVSQGKKIRRVHIIPTPLTPYLKYEIEWGYLYASIAGEDIHLLDRAKASHKISVMKDFWLFDRETLVLMHYDSAGRFLHGEREDSPEVVKTHSDASASLVTQAVPLKTFLAQARAS